MSRPDAVDLEQTWESFGRALEQLREIDSLASENWSQSLMVAALLFIATGIPAALFYVFYERVTEGFKPLPRALMLGYLVVAFAFTALRFFLLTLLILFLALKELPLIGLLASLAAAGLSLMLTTMDNNEWVLQIPFWIGAAIFALAGKAGGQSAQFFLLAILVALTIVGLLWRGRSPRMPQSKTSVAQPALGERAPNVIEPKILLVSKDEVERGDITRVASLLQTLKSTPETARAHKERLALAIDGYDDADTELFDIPEVRDFVQKLDEHFPFWLYVHSKSFSSLQMIALCFLPPYLTKSARARIFPQKLNELLIGRWLPALNHIGEFVGMNEVENKELTDRALRYFTHGPF